MIALLLFGNYIYTQSYLRINDAIQHQLAGKIDKNDFVEIDLNKSYKITEIDFDTDTEFCNLKKCISNTNDQIIICKNLEPVHEIHFKDIERSNFHILRYDSQIEYFKACNFSKNIVCNTFTISSYGDKVIITFYKACQGKLKVFEVVFLKDFFVDLIKDVAVQIIHKVPLDFSRMTLIFGTYYLDDIKNTLFDNYKDKEYYESSNNKEFFEYWISGKDLQFRKKYRKNEMIPIENCHNEKFDFRLDDNDIENINSYLNNADIYEFAESFIRVLHNKGLFKVIISKLINSGKNLKKDLFLFILQQTGYNFEIEKQPLNGQQDFKLFNSMASHFINLCRKYKNDEAIKHMVCIFYIEFQTEIYRNNDKNVKKDRNNNCLNEMFLNNRDITKKNNLFFLSFFHKIFNSIKNIPKIRNEVEKSIRAISENILEFEYFN